MILIALTLLLSPLSQAEQSIDFSQALEHGLKANPSLARAKETLNATSAKKQESLGTYLPRVQATANHTFSEKYLSIPFGLTRISTTTPKTIATIGAYWTVFDGFQGWNNYQGSDSLNHAAKLELDRAEQQAESDIRTAFYRALATKLLVEVNEQNVAALKEHLAKTQQTLNRGSSTKFDVLKVQVQLEDAENELLHAEDLNALAKRYLGNALGEESADWNPTGTLPQPSVFSPTKEAEWRKTGSIDSRTSLLRAQAVDRQSSAGTSIYWPKLTLYSEKQFYNTDTHNLSDPYLNAYSVGISLNWTIFDYGLISRSRALSYQAAESALQAKETHLRSLADEENWLQQLRYSEQQFQAKKRALEFASEEYRLAKIGFSAGTRTTTDVLDAQVDLTRAKAGILRAQIDNIEALGKLETIYGRSK